MAENNQKPSPLHFISRSIVRPFSYENNSSTNDDAESNSRNIFHLTPWDLCLLSIEYIQKGILLPKPPTPLNLQQQHEQIEQDSIINDHPIISRLITSLSQTLDHFFPLAGRLSTIHHGDASLSVLIDCNNKGAEFTVAAAKNITISDIVSSVYVPDIIPSFFPLNGAICLDGHSLPLLAIQLTELADGAIFIGCSANHAVIDGTSFWHFLNSWSEISRSEGLSQTISCPPILDRWFPDSIKPPIHLPFKDPQEFITRPTPSPDLMKECFFHFSARSIKDLKARANSEMNSTHISSLQALLAHVWRSVVRARKLEADQETTYILIGGQRSKTDPPLPEAYFGNSVIGTMAKALAGDIISKGHGWVARQLNRAVDTLSNKEVERYMELWCKEPFFITECRSNPCNVFTGSSPRFNVYGNDFGWGKPVAVRSGCGGKSDGRVTVYPGGTEQGSMGLEVCLVSTALMSLVDDVEFMEAVGY